MNQDMVKELLLEIEESQLEFSVTFTGKMSKKVNGLYKPDTHEIILHNKNFANDNELIYTAIHEYTHHRQCEKGGGFYSTRVHSPQFWTAFHLLLEEAEKKGIYKITLDESPELLELTEEIKQTIMVEDGKILKELGRLLMKARPLCKKAGVRYEDYVDRVLCLPRASATTMEKISAYNINPEIGGEAMRQVAKLGSPEKRATAEQLFLNKNSPAAVRAKLSPAKKEDPRRELEKQKHRLEKTIVNLQAKLEAVEDRLANMSIQPFVFVFIFSILIAKPIVAQESNQSDIPQIPSIPGVPTIPQIPDIPNISPETGRPNQPIIPKTPVQLKVQPIEKTIKKSKEKNSPTEYLNLLNNSQQKNFLQELVNSVVTDDKEGSDLLNKILNELPNSKTLDNKSSTQTITQSVNLEKLNINGKNILPIIQNVTTSNVSNDKSFFLVAEFKKNKSNSNDVLYIFAKKNSSGKFKLYIKSSQKAESEDYPIYELENLSPINAELNSDKLTANLKSNDTEIEISFKFIPKKL